MKEIIVFVAVLIMTGCASKPPTNYYPSGFVPQSEIHQYWAGGLLDSIEFPDSRFNGHGCVGAIYSIDQSGYIVSSRVFVTSLKGVPVSADDLLSDAFDRMSKSKYNVIEGISKPISTNIVLKYFSTSDSSDAESMKIINACAKELPEDILKIK